tara:strand:- start:92 stop:508 length:417 start_codon:yes stop_codon:yes gene_type:complete
MHSFIFFLIILVFTNFISCSKSSSRINLSGLTYFDDITSSYVYFESESTLYYSNKTKKINQYLEDPKSGFRIDYVLSKDLKFSLFPIDLPTNTAIRFVLSNDLNRLLILLGAPGHEISYLLIKEDPKNETLRELKNVY